MLSRQDIIDYCKKYENVYDDYPFGEDNNWLAMRLKQTKKCFIFIYERNNNVCINAKCDPMYSDFLREVYNKSITPAYHMNKKHWNTIVIDGLVDDAEIYKLIDYAKSLVENSNKKSCKI